MCYCVKFGSSASKGVRRNRTESPFNWGRLGPLSLAVGAWLTHAPPRVILPNLVVLGQTVRALELKSY